MLTVEKMTVWGFWCSFCLQFLVSSEKLFQIIKNEKPVNIAFWLNTLLWLHWTAAATARSLQLCPTLCDPIDGRLPGSPVPGILQARTLEWVASSFANAWKWKVKGKSLSRVWLFATPWTAAYQAPLSMGFSRQEYWSRAPSSSPLLNRVRPKSSKYAYMDSMYSCISM